MNESKRLKFYLKIAKREYENLLIAYCFGVLSFDKIDTQLNNARTKISNLEKQLDKKA